MDDVTFGRNGPCGDSGVAIPGRSLMSMNALYLMCDQGSLVCLSVQDYKSLCAAVTICATLIYIQTHRQHFDQLV